ncbi:MAG: hypothetical protein QNJ40_23020 [Xanthomonadales bacterium]|nr:hypothetical protein [Xanthomonadales bacterium]
MITALRSVSFVSFLIVAVEASAFDGPQLLSEFNGVASFAQCIAGDTTDDGRRSAFECGQAIYMRTEYPGAGFVLVSKTPSGQLPNRGSLAPTIDRSGNLVMYVSIASNIVPDDNNDPLIFPDLGGGDVFLYDSESDSNVRIAFDRFGMEVPYPGVGYGGVSSDFRHLVLGSETDMGFSTDSNGELDAFYLDRATGSLEWVSRGADGNVGPFRSLALGISEDGNRIFLKSANDNFIENDLNGQEDVFVYDRPGNEFQVAIRRFDGALLSASDGEYYDFGRIRGSGSYIVYTYAGSGLVDGISSTNPQVYLTDLEMGTTELVSRNLAGGPGNGASYNPEVSANGQIVAFSSDATDLVGNDQNGFSDVFVRDRVSDLTVCVSRTQGGELGNAQSGGRGFRRVLALSSNGRFLQFPSEATNFTAETNGQFQLYLVDVFSALGFGRAAPIPALSSAFVILMAAMVLITGLVASGHKPIRTAGTRD